MGSSVVILAAATALSAFWISILVVVLGRYLGRVGDKLVGVLGRLAEALDRREDDPGSSSRPPPR